MKAFADTAGELEIRQQQIDTYSNPDLSHDRIPGSTKEALDLQILLDPFEEQFDLPAGFVDLRDRTDSEMKIVSQKEILDAGFGILEADTTQWDGAMAGLGDCQLDGLIAGQAFRMLYTMAFGNPITGIPALPGDEEDAL